VMRLWSLLVAEPGYCTCTTYDAKKMLIICTECTVVPSDHRKSKYSSQLYFSSDNILRLSHNVWLLQKNAHYIHS